MTCLLYEEDFEKYPSAIVDYKTRNQDFVRLAALYKEMGSPWAGRMILSLINPDLQGVDPFNPPDKATADAVAVECKMNFWYFIREIARDPQGSDEFPLLFKPNRGVIALYWLYFNHIVLFLIMIRQTGKSFGIDWLYIYLLNIGVTKYEIAHLTKDEKLRSRELTRIKSMELTLPWYLKQRKDTDPGNTEVLKVSSLENYFRCYVPNKSPKIADMIGRGMTAGTAGVDELAYIFNNFITIPVMLSATLTAREVAAMKGEPYGTIFATTSGKRDTPEGRYAYRLVHDAAVWSEAFYNVKNRAELEKIILAACPTTEKKLHVNCTFNHRQLGKTDKWLRDRLAESIQEDQVQVEADFLNLWPSGSTLSPFTKEVAETIRGSEVSDYYTQFAGDAYALRWYYPEPLIESMLRNTHHILTIDPSDAVGLDGIGVNLLNVVTGEEAMAATISMTNLIRFCQWLADFLENNLNVTLICERRGSGSTIMDYLLLYLSAKGINPFTRMYNTVVQDADIYEERFKEVQGYLNSREDLCTKYKKSFGFATSGSGTTSRSDLYSKTLNAACKFGATVVRDKTLILQLLGLVIKNGRVDHQDGEHDDQVISWLLGWWLMTLGKNLSYYGIDPRSVLSGNTARIIERSMKSGYENYVEQQAKRDVERLTELLSREKDEYLAMKYEVELERAADLLGEKDREIIAADDLINELRAKRKEVHNPGLSANRLSQYLTKTSSYQAQPQYNDYMRYGNFSSDAFL